MISLFVSALLPLAQYGYDYGDYGSSGFILPSHNALSSSSLIGLVLLAIVSLIGSFVQSRMMASMKKFSAEPAHLTGAQVARRMLDAHGLTDHYNPAQRTVNLSDVVYSQATVAAIAVAAHECGHAVQHASAYPWLGLRSHMVPLVNIGSRLGQIVLMLGLVLAASGGSTLVAWVGLGLFASTTVFALITLPVEFDASRRALAWIQESGIVSYTEHEHARSALRWAAMTYVSAALSSIAMLLYYALRLLASSARSRR